MVAESDGTFHFPNYEVHCADCGHVETDCITPDAYCVKCKSEATVKINNDKGKI